MILKNLLRRKLRTAFSVVGVGVGISLMVAMFSVSNDLLGQITGLLNAERGDIVGIQSGRDLFNSEIPMQANGRELIPDLKAGGNVRAVSPMVWSYMTTERKVGPTSQLDYYGMVEGSPSLKELKAVEHAKPGEPLISDADPDGFIVGKRLFEIVNRALPPERKLKVGSKLKLDDLLLNELSSYFVERSSDWETMSPAQRQLHAFNRLKSAGIDPLAAAKLNSLYIRAVFEAPQPVMEAAIIFPLIRAQQLKGMEGRATVLLIELNDNSHAARNAVRDRLNAAYDSIKFERSDELLNEFENEINLFDKFTWAITLIAAVAGALGVLNIMVLSVSERTREIGLLLAIGWSRGKVLRLILAEGVVITLLGGIVGIGLGYLEVVGARSIFDLVVIDAAIRPRWAFMALGLALVLGVLASMYPAWRASRLTPMDALRHE